MISVKELVLADMEYKQSLNPTTYELETLRAAHSARMELFINSQIVVFATLVDITNIGISAIKHLPEGLLYHNDQEIYLRSRTININVMINAFSPNDLLAYRKNSCIKVVGQIKKIKANNGPLAITILPTKVEMVNYTLLNSDYFDLKRYVSKEEQQNATDRAKKASKRQADKNLESVLGLIFYGVPAAVSLMLGISMLNVWYNFITYSLIAAGAFVLLIAISHPFLPNDTNDD